MTEAEFAYWITLIGGILLTFGGWTIYRFGIHAIGFLIGFAIGGGISLFLFILLVQQKPELEVYLPWVVLAFGLLVGLLNMRIFFKLYYLIVFIAGVIYGAAIKTTFLDQWPPAVQLFQNIGVLGQSPWVELLAGLLLGLIAVLLHRHLVILLTVLLGSGLIVVATELNWLFPLLLFLGLFSQFGFMQLFKIKSRNRAKSE
jgi:hypothetical protein